MSSDTSNTNNSSEVRIEIVEEKLENSSQDDVSSINSRDEIEREKVSRMKRMFEEKPARARLNLSFLSFQGRQVQVTTPPLDFTLLRGPGEGSGYRIMEVFPAA